MIEIWIVSFMMKMDIQSRESLFEGFFLTNIENTQQKERNFFFKRIFN